MGSERYDITAKAEGDGSPSPEQLRPMVQALLADRFKLAVHRGTKELSMYALVVGKNGPKLKENHDVEPDAPSPTGGRRLRGAQFRMGRGLISGQRVPMTMLASQLAQQLGRAVVDKTGLKGNYDFSLEWTPEEGLPLGPKEGGSDAPPPSDASGPSIYTALQEQLGLKLEATKGPVEILVIDHIEKASEN